MAFRPNVGDELTLNNATYRIAEHPAAPGIPYGQEGRAGIVYQLLPADRSAGFQPAALKVFRARFRTPALVSQAEKLAAFADLPGLTVCRRTVLTPTRHADLLRREPDLTYAVLMPWIEGPTWVEVMLEKRPLTPQQALDLARAFAQVLVRMEEQGLAHCDLSGPNVLLPMLANSPLPLGEGPGVRVELVDVEGLYAPGLPRPEVLPSGSSGYAHRSAREGLWGPTADRFAGAVLLAEMLGWGDESVREACYGETYFDPAEMPGQGSTGEAVLRPNPPRYRTLTAALARHYGQPVADLFERAWRSETLADCPTFGEWLVALPEHPVAQAFSLSTPAAETTAGEQPTSPQESAAVDATAEIRAFMQAARRLEEQNKLESALKLYRQALELAQADPSLRSLAREIELTVQDVEKRAAYDTQVLKPIRTVTPASPLLAGEGPGVRSSPLPMGVPFGEDKGPEVREQPRRTSPWGWIAAGLVIFSLLAAIMYGVNLQQQQVAQATQTAIAKVTATAQARATATANTIGCNDNDISALSCETIFSPYKPGEFKNATGFYRRETITWFLSKSEQIIIEFHMENLVFSSADASNGLIIDNGEDESSATYREISFVYQDNAWSIFEFDPQHGTLETLWSSASLKLDAPFSLTLAPDKQFIKISFPNGRRNLALANALFQTGQRVRLQIQVAPYSSFTITTLIVIEQ
jgi:hypothetical protein